MSATGSTRAILAAFVANLSIALAKFAAFLVTGSAAMLAESIHSGADTSNQALLLLGGKQAKREASKIHQFGYGRARYFWSFVVAMVLFSLGGLFAIYEGIRKIRDPHEIDQFAVAIGVLLLGIVLEGFSLRTAVVEARRVMAKDQSLWAFIRDSRMPELPVVLLEDFGAMVGLVVALSALTLAAVTDNAVWDGWGTLIIGVLLFAIAAILAREMKSLILGEGLSEDEQRLALGIVQDHHSVRKLTDLRSQHMGPDTVLIGANIEFDSGLGSADIAAAIDEIEEQLSDALPYSLMIYLEPDLHESSGP